MHPLERAVEHVNLADDFRMVRPAGKVFAAGMDHPQTEIGGQGGAAPANEVQQAQVARIIIFAFKLAGELSGRQQTDLLRRVVDAANGRVRGALPEQIASIVLGQPVEKTPVQFAGETGNVRSAGGGVRGPFHVLGHINPRRAAEHGEIIIRIGDVSVGVALIGIEVGDADFCGIAAVGSRIDLHRQNAIGAGLLADGVLPLPVKRAVSRRAATGHLMAEVGELKDLRGINADDRRHDAVGHREGVGAGVGGDGDVRPGAVAATGNVGENSLRQQNHQTDDFDFFHVVLVTCQR